MGAAGFAPPRFGDRAAASVNEVEAGTYGREGSDATAGDLVVVDRR